MSLTGTLMQPMGTMGGTVIGGTSLPSSGLGTSIVPPSNYSSNSVANTTFTNPLVSSNPSRILGIDCKCSFIDASNQVSWQVNRLLTTIRPLTTQSRALWASTPPLTSTRIRFRSSPPVIQTPWHFRIRWAHNLTVWEPPQWTWSWKGLMMLIWVSA